MQFFQRNEKINLLSIRAMTLWIMLMNKKFKAWTLYRNPVRNWHRIVFISPALNMSYSFGHSGCSIETRRMVRNIICKMLSIFSQPQYVNREYPGLFHINISSLLPSRDFQSLLPNTSCLYSSVFVQLYLLDKHCMDSLGTCNQYLLDEFIEGTRVT